MRKGGSSGLSLDVAQYHRLRHDKVIDKPKLTNAEITAADAQFPHHAERTWAHLGRCVSRYQECDDFIEFVFLSMWDGSIRPQMRAVYSALGNRDLVTRCKVITKAIEAGPTPKLAADWKVLVAALRQGADRRAEYAHARSVTFGGGIAIEIDEITGLGVGHRRLGPREMQLRRSKLNDERVWTLSGLVDEHRRLTDLLAKIQAFAGRLRDASDASRSKAAPGSGQ